MKLNLTHTFIHAEAEEIRDAHKLLEPFILLINFQGGMINQQTALLDFKNKNRAHKFDFIVDLFYLLFTQADI